MDKRHLVLVEGTSRCGVTIRVSSSSVFTGTAIGRNVNKITIAYDNTYHLFIFKVAREPLPLLGDLAHARHKQDN